MATIYENAVLKDRRAVTALYEDYRYLAAGVNGLLGGDGSRLPAIWKEIFTGLDKADVDTEEDFRTYVIKQVTSVCRASEEKDAFRAASLRSGALPEDTADATVAQFREALDILSVPERYAEVLKMFGMDSITSGRILKLKPASVEKLENSAELRLAEKLGGKVPEGLGELLIPYEPDGDADKACMDYIKSFTKSGMGRTIAIAALSLAVLAAVLLGLAGKSAKNKEPDKPDEPQKDGYEYSIDMDLTYYADIEIADYGTITVVLDQSQAPITVDNFVKLAESGFYDGLTFHRIIEGFMMQGGAGSGAAAIKGEFRANGVDNNISHERGVISMARANSYDSGSSQFFIMHQDYPSLDGLYAAFGHVISGIEVVDAVCEAAEPTDSNGSIAPEARPVIKRITIRTEP